MTGRDERLDDALLAAHAAKDRPALVDLYLLAAEQVTGDAAAFFRTQAWVFALEAGDTRAPAIEARLVETGHA